MREQGVVLCLVAAYVAVAALHLTLLSRSSLSRLVKVAATLAMTGLYVIVFYSTQGLLGWSAALALPDRFKVVATRVVEPNVVRKEPGAIHLWVEELDERNIPSGVPRAFLLPYSPELASRVHTAQSEINKGNAQAGTSRLFVPTSGTGDGTLEGANVRTVSQGATPGGDPSGGGVLDPAAIGGQMTAVDLIPLPPPLLPPKDDP